METYQERQARIRRIRQVEWTHESCHDLEFSDKDAKFGSVERMMAYYYDCHLGETKIQILEKAKNAMICARSRILRMLGIPHDQHERNKGRLELGQPSTERIRHLYPAALAYMYGLKCLKNALNGILNNNFLLSTYTNFIDAPVNREIENGRNEFIANLRLPKLYNGKYGLYYQLVKQGARNGTESFIFSIDEYIKNNVREAINDIMKLIVTNPMDKSITADVIKRFYTELGFPGFNHPGFVINYLDEAYPAAASATGTTSAAAAKAASVSIPILTAKPKPKSKGKTVKKTNVNNDNAFLNAALAQADTERKRIENLEKLKVIESILSFEYTFDVNKVEDLVSKMNLKNLLKLYITITSGGFQYYKDDVLAKRGLVDESIDGFTEEMKGKMRSIIDTLLIFNGVEHAAAAAPPAVGGAGGPVAATIAAPGNTIDTLIQTYISKSLFVIYNNEYSIYPFLLILAESSYETYKNVFLPIILHFIFIIFDDDGIPSNEFISYVKRQSFYLEINPDTSITEMSSLPRTITIFRNEDRHMRLEQETTDAYFLYTSLIKLYNFKECINKFSELYNVYKNCPAGSCVYLKQLLIIAFIMSFLFINNKIPVPFSHKIFTDMRDISVKSKEYNERALEAYIQYRDMVKSILQVLLERKEDISSFIERTFSGEEIGKINKMIKEEDRFHNLIFKKLSEGKSIESIIPESFYHLDNIINQINSDIEFAMQRIHLYAFFDTKIGELNKPYKEVLREHQIIETRGGNYVLDEAEGGGGGGGGAGAKPGSGKPKPGSGKPKPGGGGGGGVTGNSNNNQGGGYRRTRRRSSKRRRATRRHRKNCS